MITRIGSASKLLKMNDEEYYPGPAYDPLVYIDAYPSVAYPGDLYCNKSFSRSGPLWYLFIRRGEVVEISWETATKLQNGG